LHGKVLLQFFDLPRQRRLLDVQFLGSGGEVEFFRYSNEAPKVAKFHMHVPQRRSNRNPDGASRKALLRCLYS
jgi:hypothetical protein